MCVISLSAYAVTTQGSLVMYSTEQDQDSTWTNSKVTYARTFDAMLLNRVENDVNPSTVCYQTDDAEGSCYKLNNVGETLTKVFLKSAEAIKGFYHFISESAGTYDAYIIKILLSCK
ncbi:DUF4354 family protein [Pseudomonas sp. SDO528_S397]